MLFNSYEFIFIFLPVTLIIYFTLIHFRLCKIASVSLVIASLVFYSYWNIGNLPILLTSIISNYILGVYIERHKSKLILVCAIAINLIALGYFKYFAFFVETVSGLFQLNLNTQGVNLPLGISFFTFTQIAYLVDVYRDETKKYDKTDYFLFVTIFPHLIAGPILYHKDIVPQFKNVRNYFFSHKNFSAGMFLFTIGLFKKIMLADMCSPWAKIVFDNASAVTFLDSWIGALSYTFQIYLDFSGYSDMAVGLGLMFNIRLPINFNSPYKATSIIDFWRRWHISLSAFLKNYLYIPLGGNRNGESERIRNLLLTMLLGGLWHGAAWTFVVWGALHGSFLVVNHLWAKCNIELPKYISWVLTFTCVVFAWVFFRSSNINDALLISKAMIGLNGFVVPADHLFYLKKAIPDFVPVFQGYLYVFDSLRKEIVVLFSMLILLLCCPNSIQLLDRFKPNRCSAVLLSICFIISLLNMIRVSEFLYFQF